MKQFFNPTFEIKKKKRFGLLPGLVGVPSGVRGILGFKEINGVLLGAGKVKKIIDKSLFKHFSI